MGTVKEILDELAVRTTTALAAKMKHYERGDCCVGCGETDPDLLTDDPLDWGTKSGSAKSCRPELALKLCYNCRHLVHTRKLLAVDLVDDEIEARLRDWRESLLYERTKEKLAWYLLTRVFVARYQPKDPLEASLFKLVIVRGELTTNKSHHWTRPANPL